MADYLGSLSIIANEITARSSASANQVWSTSHGVTTTCGLREPSRRRFGSGLAAGWQPA